MQTRKPHKKSRHGCSQCKFRKVKCDEQKPKCSNCIRRDLNCDFARIQQDMTEQATAANGSRDTLVEEFGAAEVLNMKLFHHFIEETIPTLNSQMERQDVLRKAVVQESFSHKFLLHGMLALSAQHRHFLRKAGSQEATETEQQDCPDYARIAQEHHVLALSGFRHAMTTITENNCHALFAYSSFLVRFVLSTTGKDGTADLTGTHINASAPGLQLASWGNQEFSEPAEWMRLVSGLRAILNTAWEWIENGCLAPLLRRDFIRRDYELPEEIESQLTKLEAFCKKTADGDDALKVYEGGIDSLKRTFMSTLSCDESMFSSAVFIFPAAVPYGFSSLLALQRPEALAMLATFCVMLHRLDVFWWCHGVASNLIVKIEQDLPEKEKHWAQWSSEQIRKSTL